MLNAFFVIYRESFEAILIVGILYAYIKDQLHNKEALKYMWSGVAAGLLLSVLLGFAINFAQSEFQGLALEYFNNGIIFVAIILMTHMCLWMKQHARSLKGELQAGIAKSVSKSEYWSVATLACLAVGREGSETVLFLYGMASESMAQGEVQPLISAIFLGLLASVVTWFIFNRGLKFFKQQVFFQITTVLLFLTASSLTVKLTQKMLELEVLPPIQDNIWDTSFILNENSGIGRIISSLTGYHSSPSLMTVIVYVLYWIITGYLYDRPKKNGLS